MVFLHFFIFLEMPESVEISARTVLGVERLSGKNACFWMGKCGKLSKQILEIRNLLGQLRVCFRKEKA